MEAKDYILLLLSVGNQKPVYGALFLQLEVYLLVREIIPDLQKELEFKPSDIGVYSENLIKIINELKHNDLINIETIDNTVTYSITETGESYINPISFPPGVRGKIRNLKRGSDRLGFRGLLRFIKYYY